jgi:hypothetical protein
MSQFGLATIAFLVNVPLTSWTRLVRALGVKRYSVLRGDVGYESMRRNPMQDLFQSYVDDLNKFRDAFHDELTTQARELSEALSIYAQRSEAALAWLMEQVSAREVEFEAAAASRLDQFRGLPAKAVRRMSATKRFHRPHSRIRRGSRPPQNARSRTVCLSRAMAIASSSRVA